MDAVDADVDRATCRVRALLKTQTWGNVLVIHGAVAGRGAGTTSGTATAYLSAMYQNSASDVGRMVLHRYNNGATSTLHQSANNVVSANTYYWVGLDCIGDQITYSVRDSGNPETVIHTHTFTDATLSAAGHIGVFLFSYLSGNIDVGAVAIATGADEAFYTDPNASAPQGVVTISNVTPGSTTAEVTYSYNAADQTGFEYRINNGTAASIGALINVAVESQKLNANMIINANRDAEKSAAWREQSRVIVR